ncbi:MAG: hypothetical protein ACR2PL_02525, partial [Dehalococcoidia bacterium]
MAEISWSQLEPFVAKAYEKQGRIERADVIDEAYAANADDDIIDTIDAIGSRVFNTPDDARSFLA